MALRVRLPSWNRPRGSPGRLVARSLLAIAVGAFAVWLSAQVWADAAAILWYRYQGARVMSEVDQARIAQCERPSWLGLVALTAQDRPVFCPDGTASRWMAAWRATGGPWLGYLSGPASPSELARARAGLAELWLGAGPPEGFAMALGDVRADGERRAVIAELLTGQVDDGWLDPTLVREMTWARPGDASPEELADLLRLDVIERPEVRGEHTRAVLALAGVPAERLVSLTRARTRGGSIVADPVLLREVDRDHRCAGLESRRCAGWAAAQIERADPPDGGPAAVDTRPTPFTTLPRPLWDAIWQDPEVTRASSAWFDALGTWAAAGPGPEARARRVLGLVALERNSAGPAAAREGAAGDPAWVVQARGGPPWSAALAARAIGLAAAVPVSIVAIGDSAVEIRVDGFRVGVGPCGQRIVLPGRAGPAATDTQILARAAIEGAGGRMRADDWAGARRLARLAFSLDPVWADGARAVVDIVAPVVTGDAARGALLGQLVEPIPLGTGRWGHAAVEWALEVDRERCPGPLSP